MIFLFHFTYATKWFGTALQQDGIKVWKIKLPDTLEVEELFFSLTQYIQLECRFSKNSYIVQRAVEVNGVVTHTIYYLIGKYGSTSKQWRKREQIIDLVIELWEELYNPAQYNVSIVKETCEQESEEFLSIFPKVSILVNTPKRLYRVTTYRKKTIIVQVRPSFSELTKDDIFVLDSGYNEVYTFSVLNISSDLKYAVGNELIEFIKKHVHNTSKCFYNIIGAPKESYVNVNRFMFYLGGCANDLDQIKRSETLFDHNELFEISVEKNESPIPIHLDSVSLIKPDKCYLLLKYDVDEALLHIGKNVNAKQRKKCMMSAEKQEERGYLVSTVYGDRILPFAITFNEIFTNHITNDIIVNFDLVKEALFL